MSQDRNRDTSPHPETDAEPQTATASEEPHVTTESEERLVDRSGFEALDDRDAEFSWTGSEVYFPLLIGGIALVAFPEPLTSVVGLISIGIGLYLGILDLLSSSEEAP